VEERDRGSRADWGVRPISVNLTICYLRGPRCFVVAMDTRAARQTLNEEWAVLRQFLPAGWEEEARKRGALRRARGVDGAETLLRVLMIHLATGCSLAETAVRARAGGLAQLSAVALFKRLQASEDWSRWLAVEERRLLADSVPASSRRLRAVDATVVSEPGSNGRGLADSLHD